MCHTHCGRLAGNEFPDDERFVINEDGEPCECDKVIDLCCCAMCAMIAEGLPPQVEKELREYRHA